MFVCDKFKINVLSDFSVRTVLPAMASKYDLEKSLERYEEAVKNKSKNLPDLDNWYRNELQATVQSRKSTKEGAYLTTKELVKLMKWKLTRGKFRPRLEQLAASNANDLVVRTTKEAYSLLSKSNIDSAKESILKLNSLKGIGPATSSAILSLFNPDTLPFMSDEALTFAAGLNGKPKYTVKEWEWFVVEMRNRVERESWSGADVLEKAAWSFGVLKQSSSSEKSVNQKRVPEETVGGVVKRKRK